MVDLNKREQEILDFWEDQQIFKKTLEKKSPQGNFVFYEGPPTANGLPGIHHVLSRSFKDLIPRYKTMRGYHVERKAGWDTHGLPVELQVEKELGISGKPDIEKYGIEEFNKKSRESVWKYKDEWDSLTKRMGFWLDLEHPYVTYENDYIESVWWVIKQIWDQKLVYQGFKVVPHCPSCETALSSHEVAQGYKKVTETSVYIKFKVTEGKGNVKTGDYITSWTTTPWTLPGNVALAVGQDIEYARVKLNDQYYVLALNLVERVLGKEAEVENTFKGSELVGIKYEPLFKDAIEVGDNKAFEVVPANFVTTEDGTGIVHTAVMYGVDDYDLGLEVSLPQQHTVDTRGHFMESVKDLAGLFVRDEATEKKIISILKTQDNLIKQEQYTHDYPFCWRCGTPLLYYAKTSWFISMSDKKIKDRLLKNAKEINWYPEHIKRGRFGEWIEGVKDWAISRERYWGTPLPIWVCDKCNKQTCIGSRDELKVTLDDLHKPYIDNVTLSCSCGGEMHRVPEVLDVWFDSGSMPFAQYHYPFENESKIDSGETYPADYICEGIDQTRGWFYTMLAISTLLNKGVSYKNVICLGLINDADGQKMSKSKGNVVKPSEVFEKFGVDPVRLFFYTTSQPGEFKRFDEKLLMEVVRKNFNLLENILTFYKTFSNGVKVDFSKPDSQDIMDRWIVSFTAQTVSDITRYLDEYKITEAGRSLSQYINELSTWYLRRSRTRFKDEQTKEEAVKTLGYVLKTLAKVMAPFTPFTAEYLWQELEITSESSVHLADWPASEDVDNKVLQEMELVRKLVETAHSLRAESKLKIRQPLAEVQIVASLPDQLDEVLLDEINVKKVTKVKSLTAGNPWLPSQDKTVALNVELTAELKQEGAVRELIRSANSLRKQAKLTPQDMAQIVFVTDSQELKDLIAKNSQELADNTISKPWIEDDVDHQQVEVEVLGSSITLSIK